MGGILLLLGLCVVMALASFLAGALPLSMSLSQSQLRLISSIGVGVLVGTSMIIIIPEGIEASMAPAEAGHEHKIRSLVRRSPWAYKLAVRGMDAVGSVATIAEGRDVVNEIKEIVDGRVVVAKSVRSALSDRQGETMPVEGEHDEEDIHDHEHGHDHSHDHSHDESEQGAQHDEHEEEHAHVEIPTFEIGFSMVLGFILMFLIDRLPRHATESFKPAQQTQQFSLDTLGPSGGAGDDTASVDEEQGFLGSLTPHPRQARSMATTVGLVIHAAADGIAMGASSTTEDTKLGFIIFIAIMIHKAPAAFGLTSVLLRQGLSKRAARAHLIVFSLAAPVGALGTWLLITLLGGGGEGAHGQYWTGMLMLFSGGTFLYVAMHAMQEDSGAHDHGSSSNGFADASGASATRKQSGPTVRDTIATVVGMLVPLLAQLGGHHHH